jgi:DNA-binding GntR family transcriptional regulator
VSEDRPAGPADPGAGAGRRVADDLREQILSGALGPGDRIRQEEVAARTGASRLPVREALRLLEAEGLLEHERHKGARVTLLDAHAVGVLYRMRERLEPLALAESLPHLGADALARMVAVQDRIEAGVEVEEFLALDRELHLTSYTGCRVATLTDSVTRLWNATQHYRRAFMLSGGPRRAWAVNAEHRLLLDAIARRDAVDAERVLAGHIRRTGVELEGHPEVVPGVGGQPPATPQT